MVKNEILKRNLKPILARSLFYEVDICISSIKLAFEICGFPHCVWPAGNINGLTTEKLNVIQKIGWKLVLIEFKPDTEVLDRESEIAKQVVQAIQSRSIFRNS